MTNRKRAERAYWSLTDSMSDIGTIESALDAATAPLEARVQRLEAALRQLIDHADLLGSQGDELHVATIEIARAALADETKETP
jgi:hypothetical protein